MSIEKPSHAISVELGRAILKAISESNRKNLETQIQARMDVKAGKVIMTIDNNPCATQGHAREVIQSLNRVCNLKIQVEFYA